jgi:sulfoxide reductase catalytic subunit YedY
MANILKRPDGWISERQITPEAVWRDRRRFLKQISLTGAGLLAASPLLAADPKASAKVPAKKYPAKRNPAYDPKLKLCDERVAITYNNYYEFTTQKEFVHRLVGNFTIDPWAIEIGGLVEKPLKLDVRELVEMFDLEERVCRFRCVEGWSMVVPWTGFPLAKLIEKLQPKAEAKFIRFETALRPAEMPGLPRLRDYPWPYTEGLRLDEAMHPLTLVGTGLYGKPLSKQNGAPIRLVVPWKYGYKSIKSIVKIELTREQPKTLWETLAPQEYPFESNVNPAVPHPRWSQAFERVIDTGDRIRTLPFNGYGDEVAKLYKKG